VLSREPRLKNIIDFPVTLKCLTELQKLYTMHM